jgi:hypothetical protein
MGLTGDFCEETERQLGKQGGQVVSSATGEAHGLWWLGIEGLAGEKFGKLPLRAATLIIYAA